jgi:hypothetical protein
MPMIGQVCHHPCCSQGEKKLWGSHVGAYRAALAPLSPLILFSVGKSCGGLPGDHEEHVANDLTSLCPLW